MKKLLIFVFVLVGLNLSGQSLQVVNDTTYSTVKNGVFFTVNLVVYSDGSTVERSNVQLDSSAVLNDYVTKIEYRCNIIADAAIVAMQARQASINFAKMDTLCVNLTGKSPVKNLMDVYTSELSVGQWTITFSGTNVKVAFPVLSTNKRMRLLPEGGSAKTILVFGKMMRITNYPFQGINLLFRVKNGYWTSYDKTIVLMRS